jgi:oligopeptidase B
MKTLTFVSIGFMMMNLAEAQTKPELLEPPVAKQVAKVDTIRGDVRVDNYYWLREKSSPEVLAYLEAENKYTEAMTEYL